MRVDDCYQHVVVDGIEVSSLLKRSKVEHHRPYASLMMMIAVVVMTWI